MGIATIYDRNLTMHRYSDQATLQTQQISCERSDRLLFSNLSFTLHAGEMLHISGPNGSGKTSLLRILTGLASPQQGHVLWCQQSIVEQRTVYNQQLIYLSHRLNINGQLSVRHNLQFMAALSGVTPDRIEQAIEQLGLRAFVDDAANNLSAGQQRRIALARLMLQTAQVWILDEPSTSLDKNCHAWLEDKINLHLKNNGIIVLAAHQLLANVSCLLDI